MNLRLLPWTRRPDTLRAHRPSRPRLDPADEPGLLPQPAPEDDVPPRGCAWFESSHELGCGLLVTEHDSPDRVANQLPLDVWLDWQLASCAFTAGRPPGAQAQPILPA